MYACEWMRATSEFMQEKRWKKERKKQKQHMNNTIYFAFKVSARHVYHSTVDILIVLCVRHHSQEHYALHGTQSTVSSSLKFAFFENEKKKNKKKTVENVCFSRSRRCSRFQQIDFLEL